MSKLTIEEKTTIHDFVSVYSIHYEKFVTNGFQVGKKGKIYPPINDNTTKYEITEGFSRFLLNNKAEIKGKEKQKIDKYNIIVIKHLVKFFEKKKTIKTIYNILD